ncbi:hypothetical protein Tco_0531307 [Tanacetum coccineum]
MHANKSFNRNLTNHRLYHALMEALIEDENAMDKGVADIVKDHKRKHDDDEDPPAGPNQDVVRDDDQPQDTSEPKTAKTPNLEWFTQPPRPLLLIQNEQRNPSHFQDLIATSIDFSKYVLNRLKIDNLTQDILLGPAYNLLKDRLDWNNLKGDRYRFDLSKPLPLQGHPRHLTVTADYFFNNDLEYLKSFDLERTYTTSIMKTKAAQYEIEGIEDMMNKFSKHNVYSTKKILGVKSVSVKKLQEIRHLLLAVQHKLFHLTDNDIVDFIVALRMFTRSLIIKKSVEDLQLGVESYQKKLNITPPQQTFLEKEFKELYTSSHKPPGVIYEDLTKQKRVMRADELYKFLDGTLKKVPDELHHRIRNFRLEHNNEMPRRKWTAIDRKRSKLMVELIDKQCAE